MKIVKPSATILDAYDRVSIINALKKIEECGRVCYKSEDKITDESNLAFAAMIKDRHHDSVVEHVSVSVKFICDRGISHEIVRHRIASFSQESTRYCNYGKDKFGNEISVIEPIFASKDSELYNEWYRAATQAEKSYFALLDGGATPQEARSVLPNSLKTEIVMTANLREWRHFFELRTAKAAHPQMRQLAVPLLKEFKELIPIVFDDIIPYEE